MKKSYAIWYLAFLLAALAPAGLRLLAWHREYAPDVDVSMAQAGNVLFHHVWKPNDPLSPEGDGLGPVFNAASCVECHRDGGAGGSGGQAHNVTTFTIRLTPNSQPRDGVIHSRAIRFQETLRDLHPMLPAVAAPTLSMLLPMDGKKHVRLNLPEGFHLSQRNTPALFGAKLIDDLSEREILAEEKRQMLRSGMRPSKTEAFPVGRALRLADGRIGKFGWKAQTASLASFVQAACANELGLGNPGQAQPRPLGRADYMAPGLDLTQEQCDQLTAYVASLPRPMAQKAAGSGWDAEAGLGHFHAVGCADCHTPNLGSIEGIYSDLLVHSMGQTLVGGGSYNDPPRALPDMPTAEGPLTSEWRTPPLWGVADTAPYLHDGRAATLDEAILLHGGQAARSVKEYQSLGKAEQKQLVKFLQTLRIPIPSPQQPPGQSSARRES